MDILEELDISNDPEVERLGANATVQYAQEYWNKLYEAARKDSFAYDPLWNDHDLADIGDRHNDDNNNDTSHFYCTKNIVLTQSKEQDYRLYRRFRSNLSKTFWNVERIILPDVNQTTNGSTNTSFAKPIHNNPLCNDKWQSLLLACEGVIPDFNFITLLRPNVYDFPYHDDLLSTPDEVGDEESIDTISLLSQYAIVPRMQFIYIEIARCYEGYYSTKKFRQILQLYAIKGIEEKLHRTFRNKLLPTLLCDMNENRSNGKIGTYYTGSNDNNDTVRIQNTILQLFIRLATEWPYPSAYTLRTTGIVATLHYMLRQCKLILIDNIDPQKESILQPIQYACQLQLQNWHDLIKLRRLEKALAASVSANTCGSSTDVKSNHYNTIQRLVQKSYHSFVHISSESNTSMSMAGRNGRGHETMSCAKYQKTLALEISGQSACQPGRLDDCYVTRTTSKLSDIIISSFSVFYASESESKLKGSSSMASLFRDFGIVIVSNYCTEQQIQQCSNQAYLALEQLQNEQLEPRKIQVMGQNTYDFVEVRQRPGHRVDNRYKILDDPKSPIATLGKVILREFIEQRLFADGNSNRNSKSRMKTDDLTSSSCWTLLYAGVVHAFPREDDTKDFPPSQLWHRDGPSLFENRYDNHHATHCFNVFVPLVDVSQENGTTEFVPGTHEDKRYNKVVADILLNRSEKYAMDAGIVRADLKAGSLIFFDVRLLHRGLSNQSTRERPMLYFTFGRDWFQEKHMFQKIESLLPSGYNASGNMVESSLLKIFTVLYLTVLGQNNVRTNLQLSVNKAVNLNYGHPHYTLRFDLLLFEQWKMSATGNGDESTVVSNYTAVLRFHNLSNEQKDMICRDFLRILSSSDAWRLKNHVLEQARRIREDRKDSSTEDAFDFASIQHDLSDVAALYKLTVQLLMTQPSQESNDEPMLSQMGFTKDENGLCVALSLLKVYANSKKIENVSFATEISNVVPHAALEECFTLWWNAASSPSRFHSIASTCAPSDAGNNHRSVIVVFSSLGSGLCRPEWMGTLKAIGIYGQKPQVDVLHVVDFAYSWYSQDPTCTWKGYEYYMKELQERLQPYNKVFFLGDSMGGSAALRFSSLAHSVLVFTPQIDLKNYEAVTREDFTVERREQFHHEIIETMRDETNNKAIVSIHYGKHCNEDVRQLEPLMLEHKSNVQFIEHDYDDHVLSLHLRDLGMLTGLIYHEIMQEFLSL